jgi:hypothetical protein
MAERPCLPDLPQIQIPAAIVDPESAEAAREALATPAPVRQTCSRCGHEVAETISLSPAGDGASTPPLCPSCFEAATATVQAAFSGVDPALLEDDEDEEEDDA